MTILLAQEGAVGALWLHLESLRSPFFISALLMMQNEAYRINIPATVSVMKYDNQTKNARIISHCQREEKAVI